MDVNNADYFRELVISLYEGTGGETKVERWLLTTPFAVGSLTTVNGVVVSQDQSVQKYCPNGVHLWFIIDNSNKHGWTIELEGDKDDGRGHPG